MEGAELQSDHRCMQKVPLWIIEYVWAHRMMDLHDVVDPSTWPEMDYQLLSLDNPCRLRVASAQVFSIMKSRHVEHFDRVMGFLDATYRLRPTLVSPIKHMKIMFGLKTMVVMWMLREGRGLVDTMIKINQFFPRKLPQYQNKCSQHEMFLMRKSHLDFKALAQALVMDKNKLEDYIMCQMEEQYGRHYAQKVEDRLLHYLRELERVLPVETHVDMILKEQRPVTGEEKLLVEVITSDSTTAQKKKTFKKLLNCDVASCHLDRDSKHGKSGFQRSRLSKSVWRGASSTALKKPEEGKTLLEFQPKIFRGGDEDVSTNSSRLLENDDDPDVLQHHQTEEDVEGVKRVVEEHSDKENQQLSQRSSEQEAASCPQFCSKHQRWVRSILQQCPDECSEELQLQANASVSPLLFQSSSSVTSSQDLTPSNLVSCPPDQQHPPARTSIHAETAAQTCQQVEDEIKSESASDTCQRESLPQLSSSWKTLFPVVRLVDITSVRGVYFPFKAQQTTSLNHFTISSNNQAASTSSFQILTSPQRPTSGNSAIIEGKVANQPNTPLSRSPKNTIHQVQTAPMSRVATSSKSFHPPTRKSSRLSRKSICTTTTQVQVLDRSSQNSSAERVRLVTSVSLPSTQEVIPQSATRPHPQARRMASSKSKTQPHTKVPSTSKSNNCATVRTEMSRAHMRSSLPGQATLLQPCVSLSRLSAQHCHQLTKGRSSRSVEPVVQDRRQDEEDTDSSFDLNILYSSYSSTDGEDSLVFDPDYSPQISWKRLFLEYESARSPIDV